MRKRLSSSVFLQAVALIRFSLTKTLTNQRGEEEFSGDQGNNEFIDVKDEEKKDKHANQGLRVKLQL